MSSYQSSAELKASAKEHMFGHYGTAIGASLLVMLISYFFLLAVPDLLGDFNTVIGTCIYYISSFLITVLIGLFSSGISYFYLKIVCGQHVTVSDIFQGFKLYPNKALAVQAWTTLITYVVDLPRFIYYSRISDKPDTRTWMIYAMLTALSVFVTVALKLFYGQAYYLLHDFPQYSAQELLAMSRRLMTGNKRRLFFLYISFIPFALPGILSCGIALMWVIPYMNATMAEFYLDIVKERAV